MLNTLPKDPVILLSYINTKLRDNYSSLESLCDDLDININNLNTILASIGYTYNKELNKFV